MNTTSASSMTVRRAVAVAALTVGLALTGCQTGATNPPVPTPLKPAPQAPVGIDTGLPADRIAEDIERNEDRMRELSERFKGIPADRIEERLEREAAAAESGK